MSAGTLALTNGSTTVTGSSTVFQTDLAVNDFIVCKIGGTTYTLGVSTIGSNTALTLTQPFSGPTTSGVAWYAVPNQTLVGITTELAANLTTVYRSVLVNDANWTKVFSQSGNITVTLKDGSTFTGPSWNSIATTLNNKANTSDVLTKTDNLASVTNKATARANLGVDYGTTTGTVAQGNDTRLDTVNAKSGGNVSSRVTSPSFAATGSSNAPSQGTYMGWNDYNDGGAVFQNNRGGGNGGFRFRVVNSANSAEITLFNLSYTGIGYAPGGWTTGSDERIKEDIQDIDPEVALKAVLSLRHVTFKMRDRPDGEGGWVEGERSVGYLAQDLENFLPDAVMTQKQSAEFAYQCRGDNDEIIEVRDLKSIDPGKAAAALNGAAIKALHAIITKQDAIIAELQSRMKAIDGLDA